MHTETLTRAFSYNGAHLADPGLALTPEQVRDFYCAVHPDLANAEIEGPKVEGSKQVFTFRRAVGTKGATIITDRGQLTIAFREWSRREAEQGQEWAQWWANHPEVDRDDACADFLIKLLSEAA